MGQLKKKKCTSSVIVAGQEKTSDKSKANIRFIRHKAKQIIYR